MGPSLFAETILDRVLSELREKGSFGSLKTSLDWQGAMIADEQKLLAQYSEGRERREDLVAQLRAARKNMTDQRRFWEIKSDLLTVSIFSV